MPVRIKDISNVLSPDTLKYIIHLELTNVLSAECRVALPPVTFRADHQH